MSLHTGAYPERLHPHLGWFDRQGERIAGMVTQWWRTRKTGWSPFLELVTKYERQFGHMNSNMILHSAQALRPSLQGQHFSDEMVAQAFALIRLASHHSLGLRHYDVQLIGGKVLLGGLVAEMETGEGKTLTATLAAATAALAGRPVHVVTVNDYLAQRDAEWMGPLYASLGLTVGTITQGMSAADRQAAYRCDITYCTNKEVVFDYLKDRLALGRRSHHMQIQLDRISDMPNRTNQLLMRGLHFAIVDEADSALIDEARTPLIISGPSRERPEQQLYEQALDLSHQLEQSRDFLIDEQERTIRLTSQGIDLLTERGKELGGLWKGRSRREDLIQQALSARYLFSLDKHYLVRDQKVQIIDEYTGRVMPDRSWEHGLHQMIELKEQCPLSARQDPIARITYQRFFRRYVTLAGMTGTAKEVKRELGTVYHLGTVALPTHRTVHRHRLPDQIYSTLSDKWEAVITCVQHEHSKGRPVLIGTGSVSGSEHVSAHLQAAGLPHRVLNARQDQEEANIIAQAGQQGVITVATNMAGRGTDIVLGPGVAELGGLHVLTTERHEARRIDRQLFGRCGRQGNPGTCQAILSLEDELVTQHLQGWKKVILLYPLQSMARIPTTLARFVFWVAQLTVERQHAHIRNDLLRRDEQLETTLAFSGKSE